MITLALNNVPMISASNLNTEGTFPAVLFAVTFCFVKKGMRMHSCSHAGPRNLGLPRWLRAMLSKRLGRREPYNLPEPSDAPEYTSSKFSPM